MAKESTSSSTHSQANYWMHRGESVLMVEAWSRLAKRILLPAVTFPWSHSTVIVRSKLWTSRTRSTLPINSLPSKFSLICYHFPSLSMVDGYLQAT